MSSAKDRDDQLKSFLRRPQKKRRFGRLLLVLGFLLICYVYVGGDHGLLRIWSQHNQIEELKRETQRLRAEQYDLSRECLRLESDSLFIEKKAREELGMVRRGERVYQFVPPADTTAKVTGDEI